MLFSFPRVLFFGTPDFAAEVLVHLLERGVPIVGVVSKPDKPRGRSGQKQPTAVKQVWQRLIPSVPLFQPERVSDPQWAEGLRSLGADLFVVVAYGEIIKNHLLDMPPLGSINLHASLLPRYRGAAPIQRCLMEGAEESGVSIIYMASKMDAGDILVMESLTIPREENYGELRMRLALLGKRLLFESILALAEGRATRIPQHHALATYAHKVELEECEIDWNRRATEIHDLIRAVNPEPGAWCRVFCGRGCRRLKVWRSALWTGAVEGERAPGTLLSGSSRLILSTGEGWLELREIQVEGRRVMAAEEWLRGLQGVPLFRNLPLEEK